MRKRVRGRKGVEKMSRHKTSFSYRCDGELVSTWAWIGINIIVLVKSEVFDFNLVVISGHFQLSDEFEKIREIGLEVCGW